MDAPPLLVIGETVGNYQVTSKISEGGMGAVYRAEHVLLGRPVALKVLLPIWSANPEIVQRFFDEATLTASIRHPGVVEIFDFGQCADGRAYLVMELLRGEPLSRRLARNGRLPEASAALLVRSLAGALAAAHERGVIHRDLKPDNIYLVSDPDVAGSERPKLLDFGIAKRAARCHDRHATRHATQIGLVVGTPAYMSPEQCRCGELDGRADLYSLGCILYELLAGRPPFVADSAADLMAAHLFVEPEPLRVYAPDTSVAMAALVARLLAKQPMSRPASATDVIHTLDDMLVAPPVRTRNLAPRIPEFRPLPTTTLGGTASARSSMTTILPRRRRVARVITASLATLVVAAAALVTVHQVRRAHPGAFSPEPDAVIPGVVAPPQPPQPPPASTPAPVPAPPPEQIVTKVELPVERPRAAKPARRRKPRVVSSVPVEVPEVADDVAPVVETTLAPWESPPPLDAR